MKSRQQKNNRAAVARSLLELKILFGKEPTDRKSNAAGKSGADEAGKLRRGVRHE